MPKRCSGTIVSISAEPVDIALSEPFGIATGAQAVARNVFVALRLEDGSVGLGEAAPFPAVNGETQEQALRALTSAADRIVGLDVQRFAPLVRRARELMAESPSARAALESAALDALCQQRRCSLWQFFGAAEPELVTDITIPTGSPEHAATSAASAVANGFSTLKVKVGGAPLEHDIERVRALTRAAPNASLVLDANGSMTPESALEFWRGLGEVRERIVLFEQPTPACDLEALRAVRQHARVPIAADESARSARDVANLAAASACDVINIKIMKTGIAEALVMAATARAHGLGLMIGGMVESELSMSVSACLAAGIGGFSFVDLDTPLFLRDSPARGGYVQNGARLRVDGIDLGHGVRLSRGIP